MHLHNDRHNFSKIFYNLICDSPQNLRNFVCQCLSHVDHLIGYVSQNQHIAVLPCPVYFVTLYFRRSFLILKGSPHNFRKLSGEESRKVRAAVINGNRNNKIII